MPHSIPLPIDPHIPEILQGLEEHKLVVLVAPPGSGKSTRVAPALAGLGMASSSARVGQVLLLQPRRMAARATARRMAFEVDQEVGQDVGYQVRFDSCVSERTRLIALTPGILLRRLVDDPLLEFTTTIIFDEFHERTVECDLILGILLELQQEFRPELQLVIMSATLDDQQLANFLSVNRPTKTNPIIDVQVAQHRVEIKHAARMQSHEIRQNPIRRIVDSTVATTMKVLNQHAGDVLVFLPGVGEIRQVQRALEPFCQRQDYSLLTLYGDMPAQEQDSVLRATDKRKVILSTNVAETSLTIDGIKVVVDSGWARVARACPISGLNRLELEPISRASATQRAGRAGRTAPGICYRLWDEVTHRSRPEHLDPEVLRVELSGAVLQLTHLGQSNVDKFAWISSPPADALSAARLLLFRLGACHSHENLRLNDLGKTLVRFSAEPRIARLLIEAHRLQALHVGSLAAAMLSERDTFEPVDNASATLNPHVEIGECDVTNRVMALKKYLDSRGAVWATNFPWGRVRKSATFQLQRVANQLYQQAISALGPVEDVSDDYIVSNNLLAKALLTAYPDRVAKRRSAGNPKGLMVGGKGVRQEPGSNCLASDLFICVELMDRGAEASVRLSSGIEQQWLPVEFLAENNESFYNPTTCSVVTRKRVRWLDLAIAETPQPTILDNQTARILAREASILADRILPADKSLMSWLARVRWLAQAMPEAELPSFAGESWQQLLNEWCIGCKSLEELRKLPWKSLLDTSLTYPQHQLLGQQAPEFFQMPSGKQFRLVYEEGKPPILAARIQDFFGLLQTPCLAGGRVRLVLHLLAPNNRCQQITEDLGSFWQNTYPVVRKELRGRYPKHDWPENPLNWMSKK
ncbi:MAG: ATP-dependent helicase HrpB [Planctomycetales bacterium]|nr:ATP-dependent helicase HrpB [Planctomycetales bacterium]